MVHGAKSDIFSRHGLISGDIYLQLENKILYNEQCRIGASIIIRHHIFDLTAQGNHIYSYWSAGCLKMFCFIPQLTKMTLKSTLIANSTAPIIPFTAFDCRVFSLLAQKWAIPSPIPQGLLCFYKSCQVAHNHQIPCSHLRDGNR